MPSLPQVRRPLRVLAAVTALAMLCACTSKASSDSCTDRAAFHESHSDRLLRLNISVPVNGDIHTAIVAPSEKDRKRILSGLQRKPLLFIPEDHNCSTAVESNDSRHEIDVWTSCEKTDAIRDIQISVLDRTWGFSAIEVHANVRGVKKSFEINSSCKMPIYSYENVD